MTITSEEQTKAARAVFARHRRRTHEPRCAFCGGQWRRPTGGGLIAGCAARRYAGEALAAVGQLDVTGHPTRPISSGTPAPTDEAT